jgi:hypothetical protein
MMTGLIGGSCSRMLRVIDIFLRRLSSSYLLMTLRRSMTSELRSLALSLTLGLRKRMIQDKLDLSQLVQLGIRTLMVLTSEPSEKLMITAMLNQRLQVEQRMEQPTLKWVPRLSLLKF